MSKRAARLRGLSRFLPGAGVVGLAALAVIDIVLVMAALDHVNATLDDAGAATSAPSTSPAAGSSGSPTGSDAPVARRPSRPRSTPPLTYPWVAERALT